MEWQSNNCNGKNDEEMSLIMENTITLRPEMPEDENFLFRVYACTREEELAVLDWDEAEKESFLQMQFMAQTIHYRKYYYDSDFLIIIHEERAVGRLYVVRLPKEIRIVDIALLPEARNKGIGTRLLSDLLEEGREKRLTVSIHVEHYNPAMSLYKRLGFQKKNDIGIYYLMEWTPP